MLQYTVSIIQLCPASACLKEPSHTHLTPKYCPQEVHCIYISEVLQEAVSGPILGRVANFNKKNLLVVCKVGLRTIILRDNFIRKHWWTIAYFYELNIISYYICFTNIWDYIANQILKMQELITSADGVFSH